MSKTLFIIGASSDIGLSLISQADTETTIIAHCNSNCSLLEQVNRNIHTIKADLTSESEIRLMLDQIEKKFQIPDQIVHLAAPKAKNIRFKDLEWMNFQSELDIQVKPFFMTLNRFLPIQAKKKVKTEVVCMLTSYTYGVPPMALAHYTSTKYTLLGLVKSLVSEYAAKNIRINCVSPSMVDTKFLTELNEKVVELNADANPLKRNATPAEIANVIGFLLSENSSYINGANIPVSGGSNF